MYRDGTHMHHDRALNDFIADRFVEVAELLETQHADPNRVRAYRRGADTLRGLDVSVADVYPERGRAGLVELPAIGEALARAIAEIVDTGRWRWLDRLRGEVDPEAVLQTVADIGPGLAARIHSELGIEDLEELEVAAHDGRLAAVEGFGDKRLRAVRESLAGRFRRPSVPPAPRPSVAELLDIDREYRERAAAGALRRIAPRRFNPAHDAWLPILHTSRGARAYTALYSNTARAHELGKTDDWVVVYLDSDDGGGQWTVVTEAAGPLAGRRVVRGREMECRRLYET